MKERIIVLLLAVCLIGVPIAVSSTDSVSDEAAASDFEELEYEVYDYSTGETTSFILTEEYDVGETWDLLDDELVEQMMYNSNVFIDSEPFAFGNLASTRSIIGTDTRYTVSPERSPYCAVAFLSCGTSEGTAYLVSEHVMITAAHCVVDKTTTTVKGNVNVYFGVHNGDSLVYDSYATASSVVYPTAYYNSSGTTKYDYCILKFEEPISCGYYFDCVESSEVSSGVGVRVAGYPSDYGYYQVTSVGTISSVTEYRAYYTNDTYDGMSGSPVFLTSSKKCIGIHTGNEDSSSNTGVLFWSSPYSLVCKAISSYE